MVTLTIKKVHIRKRTIAQWLTLYLMVMPLFINAVASINGLSVLKYTLDVAWVGIVVLTMLHSHLTIQKKIIPMLCVVILFLLLVLIVYAFRFQSLAYFLWGFRNNFRYYVAFFAIASFAVEEDTEKLLHFMDVLFWVNIVVSLYQYFVLGYSQDYLGGIFGTARGCNASTLIFFCIVLTRSMLLMLTQRKRNLVCILQVIAASFVAALAELKVFFLMLALITVLAMVMTQFSWKKCLLALFLIVSLFFGSIIITELFGDSHTLSMENIIRLVFSKNYSSQRDLGRLSAIPILSRTILQSPLDQTIGLGLGNCDTSAFAICNTPFYQAHSSLNYTWFSTAMLFLETGYIGLLLFLTFFGLCLLGALKKLRNREGNLVFSQITIIMSVLCVVLTIYNSSLRTDIGYLAYFALASAFIKTENKEAM